MLETRGSGFGGHRSSESTSGAAILAAFIPTFVSAVLYLAIFAALRNRFKKHYAPRTFLGTVPEKDRTPASHPSGAGWFHDFRTLPTRFVLTHSSLDAFLYLRFLKFIIAICFLGSCLALPILIPINATGGGNASQLDKITFSNITKNSHLWAHTVVAWVFFLGILLLIARERLLLIGTRQAYLLSESRSKKLSARTVLFLNVPKQALLPENLQQHFGEQAERSWPVKDTGDISKLVQQRNDAAMQLESAEYDFIARADKQARRDPNASTSLENGRAGSKAQRPSTRQPPLFGAKHDLIEKSRAAVVDYAKQTEAHRAAPGSKLPGQSAVFVAFSSQGAAHRAYETLSFKTPAIPLEDRYLEVLPKEVLWENVTLPMKTRLSKASLALVFVIAFTIFFSIPVGIIGTISNISYLADEYAWLNFLNDLPDWLVGLISGLLPPFLVSWFVSYVPKLFRHIAKLSGEPTTPQAELKTQAWVFFFQVFQVFLITTFSSGAAAVASKIIREPHSAPVLLAESLPKASNFYLTYFLIQGLTSAASNILNYSDLFEYLFYQCFWDKTPREKFTSYSQMKGISYGSLYPKFTNLLVIAIAYSCIAPLILAFATIGLTFYYISYRYNLLYVCLNKIDTRGENYKRALQQIPTGVYLAELALIGLFSAPAINLVLDRILRPLELYLGLDKLQEAEVPLLAEEDNVPVDDEVALHMSAHNRRLGIQRLGTGPATRLSEFFDTFITSSRDQVKGWLAKPDREDDSPPPTDEELANAYENPAFTSKTPKLWLPKDKSGVSKDEIRENEEVGIPTTDDAAEIDDHGKLRYASEFEQVPIWKKPKSL
ncbi:hypothetical protein Q7P37_002800 [Cladosporium fusiforme]